MDGLDHKVEGQASKKQMTLLLCPFIWAAAKGPPTFRAGLPLSFVAIKTSPHMHVHKSTRCTQSLMGALLPDDSRLNQVVDLK